MTRHPAALDAAGSVAEALTEPHKIPYATRDRRARPQSLAGGAVGIALLHIERDRSGYGDEATTHAWLSLAASQSLSTSGNANLFHGAPALGFVLHAAAGTTNRYRRALVALDDQISSITRSRLGAAHARIDRGDRLPMREFDLVHGLTGLGVYHLHRHSDQPITRDVLEYLIRLTQPFKTNDERERTVGLPPWWLPVGLTGEADPQRYPHGHGNLGVAHGIGAVIALLSLAILQDVPMAGGPDALAELCAWTDQWRQDTDPGPWWPGYLTLDHLHQGIGQKQRPRPSWCYGIAGTARAQQLAGVALGDTARQQAAESAILAALRDPAQHALLPEIGLCHGRAGLLQAAWRMADHSRSAQISGELPDFAARLAAQLSGPISDPELMDGGTGAALALHTVGTGTAPASHWDAFLLLA